jgi:hypothetical protein
MRDASSGDKLKIALFGELSLEEVMDLSRDRQILDIRVYFEKSYFGVMILVGLLNLIMWVYKCGLN